MNFSSVSFEWAEKQFGHAWSESENQYAVVAGFEKLGSTRSLYADANSFLYTAMAIQSFNVEKEAAKLKAKVLFISSHSDLIFPSALSYAAAERLRALHKRAEVFEIQGTGGHLDGLYKISDAALKITKFLAK